MTKSAKWLVGMGAVGLALMIGPMLAFTGLIRNEKISEADPEFVKSIGPMVTIPAPPKMGDRRTEFSREGSSVKLSCVLPPEARTKEAGFAYELGDAIISVIFEGKGAEGQGVVTRFSGPTTQPVKTLNGFIGAYEERDHPGAPRRDRMYYLGSPAFSYSMMISWPHRNEAAKKDAETLASWVAYSVELN